MHPAPPQSLRSPTAEILHIPLISPQTKSQPFSSSLSPCGLCRPLSLSFLVLVRVPRTSWDTPAVFPCSCPCFQDILGHPCGVSLFLSVFSGRHGYTFSSINSVPDTAESFLSFALVFSKQNLKILLRSPALLPGAPGCHRYFTPENRHCKPLFDSPCIFHPFPAKKTYVICCRPTAARKLNHSARQKGPLLQPPFYEGKPWQNPFTPFPPASPQ